MALAFGRVEKVRWGKVGDSRCRYWWPIRLRRTVGVLDMNWSLPQPAAGGWATQKCCQRGVFQHAPSDGVLTLVLFFHPLVEPAEDRRFPQHGLSSAWFAPYATCYRYPPSCLNASSRYTQVGSCLRGVIKNAPFGNAIVFDSRSPEYRVVRFFPVPESKADDHNEILPRFNSRERVPIIWEHLEE